MKVIQRNNKRNNANRKITKNNKTIQRNSKRNETNGKQQKWRTDAKK